MEVCFTKDELTVLSKKAKKAGLSIGGFVRHSVADKEIKEAPPKKGGAFCVEKKIADDRWQTFRCQRSWSLPPYSLF